MSMRPGTTKHNGRIAEAEAHREALTAKRGKLKEYLDMLRKQGAIRAFNEALWCGAVEKVRVLKDGTMRFIFKEGAVVNTWCQVARIGGTIRPNPIDGNEVAESIVGAVKTKIS